MSNYLIDIDGTICEDIPNEEEHRFADAQMLVDDEGIPAVEWVNKLYNEGHTITFFTSRLERHREVTTTWLKKHGFKFHAILFGKPRGGDYIWWDNLDVKGRKYKGVYEVKIGWRSLKAEMIDAMQQVIARAIAAGITDYLTLEDVCNAGSDDEIHDLIMEEAEKAKVKLRFYS